MRLPARQTRWPGTTCVRPAEAEYRLRVDALQQRGGFHAAVRLVAMHSSPGKEPLLAIALEQWQERFFPELMRPGALDGTEWEGVPVHLSLCYLSECPPRLLRSACHRWGRPRRVWVSSGRVSGGAACILGKRGSLARCGILKQMHKLGLYGDREPHVSL
jgi:hypothetical protein